MTAIFLIIAIIVFFYKYNNIKKENKKLLSLFTIEYNTKKWDILSFRKTYMAKEKETGDSYPCESPSEGIYIITKNKEERIHEEKNNS